MSNTENEKQYTYHHGNLKTELIETGIDFVNQNGYNSMSLRKLAALCHVSHAAIYSHFQNKEDLYEEMKRYVCEAFSKQLEEAVTQAKESGTEAVVYALALAYISFFIAHPNYYGFIFESSELQIDFDDVAINSNYHPFEIFKQSAISYLKELGVAEENRMQAILAMWATVHGIAGIAIMPGAKFSGDWEEVTLTILQNNLKVRESECE